MSHSIQHELGINNLDMLTFEDGFEEPKLVFLHLSLCCISLGESLGGSIKKTLIHDSVVILLYYIYRQHKLKPSVNRSNTKKGNIFLILWNCDLCHLKIFQSGSFFFFQINPHNLNKLLNTSSAVISLNSWGILKGKQKVFEEDEHQLPTFLFNLWNNLKERLKMNLGTSEKRHIHNI